MNIAILSSSSGSNLPSFFDTTKHLGLYTILITNKPSCLAIEKAKNAGVECFFIDPAEKTRGEYDKEILDILVSKKITYVFLIGYMRIISNVLINKYPQKIYNIHPSLLPAFAGGMDTDVHASVINHGCKITGATLHEVTEEVDGGTIIDQMACRIDDDETTETLKQKVQKLEQTMLTQLLEKIAS